MGLAAAFAQEVEEPAEQERYERPLFLQEVEQFLESFDWNDKSNITERFFQVQRMHLKIQECQNSLEEIIPKIKAFGISAQKQKALEQAQNDLYRLQSFKRQTQDFLDENRPSFWFCTSEKVEFVLRDFL